MSGENLDFKGRGKKDFMKSRINEIENLRIKCKLHSVTKGKSRLSLENRPPNQKCGLYWIYTSYTIDDLMNSTKSSKLNAVDIPWLTKSRKNLNNVIKPSPDEDFWVVYNGIGGGKRKKDGKKKGNYDLGARILQEFRDNQKTGSLKIMGTDLNDLTKWRYSFVEIDYIEYENHIKDLETGWRLEYGWPILSKQ